MKHKLLILSIIVGFVLTQQTTAKVVFFNKADFPLIALVTYEGGSEDFPKNTIKNNIPVKGAKGIDPGQKYIREETLQKPETRWTVWIYRKGKWEKVIDREWEIKKLAPVVRAIVSRKEHPKTKEESFLFAVRIPKKKKKSKPQ